MASGVRPRHRSQPAPLDPEPLLDLLRWSADYYRNAPGEVIAAALPAALRAGAALAVGVDHPRLEFRIDDVPQTLHESLLADLH